MIIDENRIGSELVQIGIDLALKATGLIAVALLGWLAVGRKRPSIGSSIGHAGLLGLLLLPASSLLFPTLSIAILPPRPVETSAEILDPGTTEMPRDSFEELAPSTLEPAGQPADPVVKPGSAANPSMSSPPIVGSKAPIRLDLAQAAALCYAIIAISLLFRLAGSLVGVERLRRSSEPVDDPAWLDRLERLVRELGIGRHVGLARSSLVGVPVVVGWFRPWIVLPKTEAGDPIDHAEAILLHELAHVRRGDYGWNLLLRVVGAIYWFQPLTGLLARVIIDSRERACDAFCVHRLGGPSAYRAALLAMAEGLTRRKSASASASASALGLAMARSSRLGRRVREIDRTRGESRCVPRWPTRLVIATLALLATSAVGPARFTRAEPQEPKPKPEAAKPQPVAPKVFHLKVVAAKTGLPVSKADVRVWMAFRDGDWRKTDENGQIDIVYATGRDDRTFSFDVWGDGFAMQRIFLGEDPNKPMPDGETVKLQPGESLGGIVQDEQGRPVSGAVVFLWSHNYKRQDSKELLYDLRAVTGPDGRWHTGGAPTTTGDLLGMQVQHPEFLGDRNYYDRKPIPPIADFRAGKAVCVLKKGVPIEGRVLGSDGKPLADALVILTNNKFELFNGLDQFAVRTNAEGRFKTGQVKPGDWSLVVRAKGHAPTIRELNVGDAIPHEEIRLQPPESFRARIVEPDGTPIEGAFVCVDTWQGYRCLGIYLYSDENGWVHWDDAPLDDLTLNIDQANHLGIFQEKAKAGSDLTFVLKPSLAVSGIVRDSKTQKSIKTATIEYGAIDPATGEVTTWQKSPELGYVWFADGRLNARFAVEAEAYKIRIRAEGYQPFVSRAFRREEKVIIHYDVNLEPAKADGPAASVIGLDGKPLAGARVYQIDLRRPVGLINGKLSSDETDRPIVTQADGTFPLPESTTMKLVLIMGDDGYAIAKDLNASPKLQALPYGRIEGRYLVGSRPLANRQIELMGVGMLSPSWMNSIHLSWKGRTDADGRFVFEKVVPMPGLRIHRNDLEDKQHQFSSNGEAVAIEGGKTTVVTLGGKGRPIVGRVVPPEGWDRPINFSDRAKFSLRPGNAQIPYPLELFRGKTSLDQRSWSDWRHSWPFTPEGRASLDRQFGAGVALESDGSFRIDDVPSGDYRVEIRVNEEEIVRGKPGAFFSIGRPVSIPDGRNDEPFDLGTFQLKARPAAPLKAGDPCPSFNVTTVDGKKRSIPGDFQGKFLLLDFGAIWDDQSRLQVVRMNEVFERFGKDDRFALLSLLMAADGPDSRQFVAEKGQPWPQAIAGPVSNPITEAFGIEVNQFPAAILIGPDGRIVAKDLYYQKIGEAIDRALKPGEAK